MSKISIIILGLIAVASNSFAQRVSNPQMGQDSTAIGIMANNGMLNTMPNTNYSSAPTKVITLPIQPSRQLYQCPALFGGSLGGGAWGYYGCRGQIGYESSCLTIEWPRQLNSSCTPIQ